MGESGAAPWRRWGQLTNQSSLNPLTPRRMAGGGWWGGSGGGIRGEGRRKGGEEQRCPFFCIVADSWRRFFRDWRGFFQRCHFLDNGSRESTLRGGSQETLERRYCMQMRCAILRFVLTIPIDRRHRLVRSSPHPSPPLPSPPLRATSKAHNPVRYIHNHPHSSD